MDIQTDGTPEGTILYTYTPNATAAIVCMALFGTATIGTFVQMCWLRAGFLTPMLLGGIMEFFGYYGRYWNHNEPHKFGAYCLQSFMLLLAPIFISASTYMGLARAATALDAAKQSLISPRWLSKLFVLGDIVCLLIQVGGLGMQATTSISIQKSGRTVVLIGLIVQIVLIVFFFICAWTLYVRLSNRVGTIASVVNWKKPLLVLCLSGVLLFIRNIYRCAEYGEGATGFVATHEAFIYVLDGLLMSVIVVASLTFSPARLRKEVRKRQKYASLEAQQVGRT